MFATGVADGSTSSSTLAVETVPRRKGLLDEQLTTCSLCLQPLCSGDVSMLLDTAKEKKVVRCCNHYLHHSCIKGRPTGRFPLCRARFMEISLPINRELVMSYTSRRLAPWLAQLEATATRSAPRNVRLVSTEAVVGPIPAVMPLSQEKIMDILQQTTTGGEPLMDHRSCAHALEACQREYLLRSLLLDREVL